MLLTHVVLTIAFILVAAIVALAFPRSRWRGKRERKFEKGVTFDQPQQEATRERPETPPSSKSGAK